MMVEKRFTGKHMLAVFVLSFGVIIAVNLTLAFKAVSTFPGLEVKNSYVASQDFDARRQAQQALGWTSGVAYVGGRVELTITDTFEQPVQARDLTVLIGRKTTVEYDRYPEFAFDGNAYHAAADLDAGVWIVKITAQSDQGVAFEQRLDLWVSE
jgi:nitrogen fixation protein FixH